MRLIRKLKEFFSGKKTYTVAVVAALLTVLQIFGLIPQELPGWVWKFLAAIGLGGVRAAINKK